MTTQSAGEWLREKRKAAMLGLRQFALLIEDSPSNVCNIENGKRPPWQNESRLRKAAEVLGIRNNTDDWDTLFSIVRRPEQPPADLAQYMNTPHVPALLRTIGEYQPTDQEMEEVLKYVRRKFRRSRAHAKSG